ncbi:MAG: hypothetical protein ACOC6S_01895 [Chloroflexota bacterium]
MKTKRTILSVFMTLAMVASLCAVAAVPASAAVTAGATNVSPNTAGSVATYQVTFTTSGTGALSADTDTISVRFPAGTSVPATINKDYVSVKESTGASASLETAPTVSGRTVTLIVPTITGQTIGNNEAVTVTFTQLAGITNPNLAATGFYKCAVETSQDAGFVAMNTYDIEGTVSRSPSHGGSGTSVTVSGAGLHPNSPVTVYSSTDQAQNTPGDDTVVATGNTDGSGSFSLTYSASQTGYIWAKDGSGLAAPTTVGNMPQFTLDPSITLTPTSGPPGTVVTVSGQNFSGANIPLATGVTVGGVPAVLTDVNNNALAPAAAPTVSAGRVSFQFRVPATVAGEKTVKVTDNAGNSASTTFEVNAFAISPTSQLTGQSVTIPMSVGGMTASGTIQAVGVGGGNRPRLAFRLRVLMPRAI